MKRKVLIKESDLIRIINRVLEQYDNESMSSQIVDKLIEVGLPDQYADNALMDLVEIEGTNDNEERRQLVSDFRSELNRIFNKFKVGKQIIDPEEKEIFFRKLKSIDILLDNLYRRIDSPISLN